MQHKQASPVNDWEVWIDVHISPIIAKWMADYTGKSVKSSYTLSLYELDDLSIYKKAKDSGNIIIVSKDTDFPDIISRLGSPPKLINLRIGNSDNKALWETIKPNINEAIKILTNSDVDIVEIGIK